MRLISEDLMNKIVVAESEGKWDRLMFYLERAMIEARENYSEAMKES